jgi:hypothetical protein
MTHPSPTASATRQNTPSVFDLTALLRWRRGGVRDTALVSYSRSASLSAPAGYRFPREVIAVAVRWYFRCGVSYRDVEELLAEPAFLRSRAACWTVADRGDDRPGSGLPARGRGPRPSGQTSAFERRLWLSPARRITSCRSPRHPESRVRSRSSYARASRSSKTRPQPAGRWSGSCATTSSAGRLGRSLGPGTRPGPTSESVPVDRRDEIRNQVDRVRCAKAGHRVPTGRRRVVGVLRAIQ